MAFHTGNRLPKWKRGRVRGGLRTGNSRTGHLERILFNEKMEELRRESLLTDLRQRPRRPAGPTNRCISSPMRTTAPFAD
jgi:hypothetical protein